MVSSVWLLPVDNCGGGWMSGQAPFVSCPTLVLRLLSSRYALGQLIKPGNPPSPPFTHVRRRTCAVLSICVTVVLTGADQSGAFTNNAWIVMGDVRSRAGLRKIQVLIDRCEIPIASCLGQARRREEFGGPVIEAADSIILCVLPESLVLASSCLGQAPLASSLTRRKESSQRWRRSRKTSTSSRIATKSKRRCGDGLMVCLTCYTPRSSGLPGAVADVSRDLSNIFPVLVWSCLLPPLAIADRLSSRKCPTSVAFHLWSEAHETG